MNTRKVMAVCSAVCMVLGISAVSYASWFVDTNVPVNSNNRRDTSTNQTATAIGIRDGRYNDSHGSNSNNRYDQRKDSSIHNADSFNTDVRSFDYSDRSSTSIDSSDNRRDSSIKDSFNDSRDMSDHSVGKETIGRDKRVNSDDTVVSAGDIKNSVLGDFGQTYTGTDFRSGVAGSGNTIDASSVNITTFGDTTTLKAPDTTIAK